MWVAEFRVWHESSHVLKLTSELDVTVLSVYLSLYKKGRSTFINKVFSVSGPDAPEYIRRMCEKTSASISRYVVHHVEDNYVFFSIPLDPDTISYHAWVLDDRTFFIRPFVLKGGYEYWTVASWDKKALTGLFKRAKAASESAKIELLSLKQSAVDLFVPDALQRLGHVQANVLQNAITQGYYGYPRKVSLKQLAKNVGLSPATIREHLRKAEAKILPAATEQLARR
ncbi:helix-turn-helix domain-containing protein [Candidatus Micrarchaeota archaeon]|nr:helix-turn-helix domain-containing protein [Candidatus Micrarchaeota archaeon]